MKTPGPRLSRAALLASALILSCAGAPPSPGAAPRGSASAGPSPGSAPLALAALAEPGLPTIEHGPIAPVVHADPIRVKIERRLVTDDSEYLEAPLPSAVAGRMSYSKPGPVIRVSTPGTAVVGTNDTRESLIVRRPKALAASPVEVVMYLPAATAAKRGERFTLVLDGADAARDPKLEIRWLEAFGQTFRDAGAFGAFATARIGDRIGRLEPKPAVPVGARGKKGRVAAPRARTMPEPPSDPRPDMVMPLMDTLTGMARIQEALEPNRRLIVGAAKNPRNIAIDAVAGPRLERHEWATMLAELGRAAPDEPMARTVPAEFWYVRARTLTALLDVLDQSALWLDLAAPFFETHGEDHDLLARYETELGLERGPLTRALGPSVVSEVAIVGSDPYFREGTDLTVIFRVKNAPMFDAAVGLSLAERARGHGAVKTATETVSGTAVESSVTDDRAVHSLRAKVGDLAIVSNSRAAIGRVLGAPPHAALADEPDFKYMLARDANAADNLLVFFGDRFVSDVVGPGQKIAEARRQIAAAELLEPGYAELFYGLGTGASARTRDDLSRAQLLPAGPLRHADGSQIAWELGQPARSAWGSVAALTPLIEMPPVAKVSAIEREAYASFARQYERQWTDYLDPIAMRVTRSASADGATMRADLRFLPFSSSRDLRHLQEMAGRSSALVPKAAHGLEAVVAIGKEAMLRREAEGLAHGFVQKLGFSWLGDWAMAGVLDSARVAALAAKTGIDLDLPPLDKSKVRHARESELFADLPAYAAIEIRERMSAAVALSVLKEHTKDFLRWDVVGTHRGVTIGRVGASESRDEITLYYALGAKAVYVSLQAAVVADLIDRELAGNLPQTTRDDREKGAQLVVDLRAKPGGGLWTVAAWLLEGVARSASVRTHATARALFDGAPDARKDEPAMRARARAVFGYVPLTPEGRAYRYREDGVLDPDWGTAYAPIWPEMPVKGGMAERIVSAIAGARSETSFDDEPGQTRGRPNGSLRLSVELDVRGQGAR